ncbi:MAG: hypothetical protein OXN27_07040 [Candidatus Poribacteria bacterium]|nr:hypothetical protein [Candidatus Poribacteria bacterium]
MNFSRKIVWTAISCTFILAVLFTVTNLVDFNSQDASAAPRVRDAVAIKKVTIKIKINYDEKTFPDSKTQEENAKESIEKTFENAIRKITDLRVVPYNMEYLTTSGWTIYCLINQEHGTAGKVLLPADADPSLLREILTNREYGTAGMSITLTYRGTFVLNHIKAIRFDDSTDLQPFIDEAIEMILNVIQQKMRNTDAPIIVTDTSTITS